MNIQPYLFFDGRAEEAIEFYKRALGAEVTALLRFKDSPERPPGMTPPGSENKVMHASFRVGETTVMASDGRCQGQPSQRLRARGHGARRRRGRPAVRRAGRGRQVQMPLAKTFFSPRFGMVADRFGVSWMVIVTHGGG